MNSRPNAGYLAQIDGLRFFAFLLVMFHHLPTPEGVPFMLPLDTNGWVGVEIFFVLSSYLFFRLLSVEKEKIGTINVGNFYRRRALRIMPLVIFYPILVLAIFGPLNEYAGVRVAGVVLGIDNLLAWVMSYNSSIWGSAHLWTLSYEMQVYIFVPVAFLLMNRIGERRFAYLLLGLWAYCTMARVAFALAGAPHPAIWVTPFLRPESVFLGILLSIYTPRWPPSLSAAGAAIMGIMICLMPPIDSMAGSIVLYPVTGGFSAALLDAALRWRPFARILSSSVPRYLGSISYGLYIFHVLAIWIATVIVARFFGPIGGPASYFLLTAGTVLASIAMAFVSYHVIERHFLRMKYRLSAVHGRPAPA